MSPGIGDEELHKWTYLGSVALSTFREVELVHHVAERGAHAAAGPIAARERRLEARALLLCGSNAKTSSSQTQFSSTRVT